METILDYLVTGAEYFGFILYTACLVGVAYGFIKLGIIQIKG
jgi:hypothetical protein